MFQEHLILLVHARDASPALGPLIQSLEYFYPVLRAEVCYTV